MPHKLSKFLRRAKIVQGFTLVEALIAIAVIVIALLVLAGLQSWFARYTSNKFINLCITQALESARITCQSGNIPPTSFPCGSLQITISSVGCSIPSSGCNDATVTASYHLLRGKIYFKVCNLK